MIKLVAMLAVLASAQNAATPSSAAAVSEPRQIAEEAMKYVVADDMKGLFAYIQLHMPVEKKKLDDLRENFIGQRKALPEALGKIVGFAFVSECRRSDFLVRLVYAEKREKNALRWEFIFYKARNNWALSNFVWDDKATAFFESCN
jgi:hypothetical protein